MSKPFTIEEKIECLRNEIESKTAVDVILTRMQRQRNDYEIEILTAVIADYEATKR